jgi:hypothetical protein
MLVVALCAIAAGATGQPPQVAPGQSVKLVVSVPNGGAASPAPVDIKPAPGVTITDVSAVAFDRFDEITFTARLAPDVAPGWLAVATVTPTVPGGVWSSVRCFARVQRQSHLPPVAPLPLPVPAPVQELPREPAASAVASLPAAQVTVPAGGAERAGVPARPTLSAVAPTAPNTLAGIVHAGATDLTTRGNADTETGYGIDLSGRFGSSTEVNAVYQHGWNPGLSPVMRYGLHRSRGHLRIRSPSWAFEAGEIRPSSTFAGIVAPADGALFHKTRGTVIGSIAAGRPKFYAGGWGGHLVQGSIGLGFEHGSVALHLSDIARPVGPSRVAAGATPDENSELVVEDLQRVGALLSRENRIRSGGIEARVSAGGHAVAGRAGWLDLINPEGRQTNGPVFGGSYSFKSDRATVFSTFRSGPPSLPGTALAGNAVTVGGKLALAGPFAFVARAYRSESRLIGRSSATRASGVMSGVEFSRNDTRLYLHGSYRESHYLFPTITRSVTAGVRVPMGVFGVDVALQRGEAEDRLGRRDIASYRGSFYVEGERASLSLSGSYMDYGLSAPRLFLDLSGSVLWRGVTLEAGTGIARAGIFGDVFNGWMTLEVPVPGDLTVLLGADYDRWSFSESPYLIFLMDENPAPPWRFTFNVRKKLAIRLPKQ